MIILGEIRTNIDSSLLAYIDKLFQSCCVFSLLLFNLTLRLSECLEGNTLYHYFEGMTEEVQGFVFLTQIQVLICFQKDFTWRHALEFVHLVGFNMCFQSFFYRHKNACIEIECILLKINYLRQMVVWCLYA